MERKTFNEALDDLNEALHDVWQSTYAALSVRVDWLGNRPLWQVVLVIDLFAIIVVMVVQLFN